MNMKTNFLSVVAKFLFLSCFTALLSMTHAQEKVKVKEDKMKVKMEGEKGMNMHAASSLDTGAIERIMGMKGKSSNGEYKITIPQNDLSVEVDGFKIIPAMGLGTW